MNYEIASDKILLFDCFNEKDLIKQIPGRRWNKPGRCWSIPYNIDGVVLANKILGISIPPPKIEKLSTPNKQLTLPADLYAHQKQSITCANSVHHFADLSEPGTGKTRVQLELLKLRKNAFPVLVICPKSIMRSVWVKQIMQVLPAYQVWLLEKGSTTIKQKIEGIIDELCDDQAKIIAIINYDIVAAVVEKLDEIMWGTIILDESTKIKNSHAKRSKAIIKLRDGARHRSIMTGTIAPNGMLDIFNQFRFIDPKIFGDLFYAFRQVYFYPGGYMNYEWLVKPGAEAAIRRKIAGLSVQHRKRECLDLPPLVEEIREVELLDSLAGKYEQMRDEYIVWLNSQTQVVAKFATTRLIKLRQIVSGFIYGEPDHKGRETISLAGCAKIAEVEDIIEEMPDQKIIIFCHFNESVKTLADHFRPPRAFTYYGGDDTHEKENALHEFENNPRCNFLIASIASAAHGLNLQFCSNVIFYELDFNLENYLQAIQRIERIGQKNKMTVYYLLTKGTVENYIYRRLRAKKSLNDDIDINELRKSI